MSRQTRHILGAVIVGLRRERGLTQEALAFRSDVRLATLSRVERGACDATLVTAGKIARALGLSLAELVAKAEGEGGPC